MHPLLEAYHEGGKEGSFLSRLQNVAEVVKLYTLVAIYKISKL